MKIGFISTAYVIPTPPIDFGGMERINHWIASQLVKEGHDVTLFGCKGSQLFGGSVVELPGGGEVTPAEGGDYPPFFDFMKNWIVEHEPMDIFHDSTHHHEFSRRIPDIPSVSTIHNPNHPESHNSIFISNFHRNYLGYPSSPFVMNGAPENEYWYEEEKEDYVLFMGALGLHKGFDRAVRFSVDYQIPLKIAGFPMGDQERSILDSAVTYPWIEYLGTIGGPEKLRVLSKAKAVLMPFRWPEPGCILAVECMASGTPILGSTAGVLPEYIVHGETGFLGCSQPEEIFEYYKKLDNISSEKCFLRFKNHFSIERVTSQYLSLYNMAIDGQRW